MFILGSLKKFQGDVSFKHPEHVLIGKTKNNQFWGYLYRIFLMINSL